MHEEAARLEALLAQGKGAADPDVLHRLARAVTEPNLRRSFPGSFPKEKNKGSRPPPGPRVKLPPI